MESLSLDDCILPVKDYPLLHNPKLHSIRLRKLDLSRLPRNESTVSLDIRHELIRAEKLPDIYPNLQRLELTACRQTNDFSFVSRLPQLQEICFSTVAKLTATPDFSRNTKLHTAGFFNCKHLAALGTLPPTLRSLSLTFSQVPFPQIEAAARSGSLKKFTSSRPRHKKPGSLNSSPTNWGWNSKRPSENLYHCFSHGLFNGNALGQRFFHRAVCLVDGVLHIGLPCHVAAGH